MAKFIYFLELRNAKGNWYTPRNELMKRSFETIKDANAVALTYRRVVKSARPVRIVSANMGPLVDTRRMFKTVIVYG